MTGFYKWLLDSDDSKNNKIETKLQSFFLYILIISRNRVTPKFEQSIFHL